MINYSVKDIRILDIRPTASSKQYKLVKNRNNSLLNTTKSYA